MADLSIKTRRLRAPWPIQLENSFSPLSVSQTWHRSRCLATLAVAGAPFGRLAQPRFQGDLGHGCQRLRHRTIFLCVFCYFLKSSLIYTRHFGVHFQIDALNLGTSRAGLQMDDCLRLDALGLVTGLDQA